MYKANNKLWCKKWNLCEKNKIQQKFGEIVFEIKHLFLQMQCKSLQNDIWMHRECKPKKYRKACLKEGFRAFCSYRSRRQVTPSSCVASASSILPSSLTILPYPLTAPDDASHAHYKACRSRFHRWNQRHLSSHLFSSSISCMRKHVYKEFVK